MEQVVTLETLGNGAVLERFGVELDKVLQNIADCNTKAEAVREITMKLKIRPDIKRATVQMQIQTSSKLAPYQTVESSGWLGKKDGYPVIVEANPNQLGLELDSPTSHRTEERKA